MIFLSTMFYSNNLFYNYYKKYCRQWWRTILLQGKEAVIHPREWWNSRQNYKTIFFLSLSKRQIRSILQQIPFSVSGATTTLSPSSLSLPQQHFFFSFVFNFSLNYAPLLQIKHHIVDFQVLLFFPFLVLCLKLHLRLLQFFL